MKNRFFNRINFTAICLIFGMSLLVSCEKDNGAGQVELQAFGPNPVLRGNTISIIGNNLDKVTSVLLPGCPEITDIVRVSSSEIKVTVPQEATSGQIIVKFPGGELVSKSLLSFTEPYVIESIEPTDKIIREGDIVTITGDYLWNIIGVVFSGRESEATIKQADFVSQDRKSIVVKVPRGASSGKIKIVDEPGNELYSDQELQIAQPVIIKLSPATIKAGSDLTIEGTNLDLVQSVQFAGGTVIDTAGFKSQTIEQIVLTVPADAHDGTILSTAYSDAEFESTTSIVLTVPTNLTVTAANGFKAGNQIEIAGNDLDLVTGLTFYDGVSAEFTYASGKITTVIPATAKNGVITLATAAEKNVETNAITLVKPILSALNPTTITAGETFKIMGANLDLVNDVKVGSVICTIQEQGATELTIATPLNTVTGNVEITAVNGDKATSGEALTVNPSTKPTVTSMPASAKPGQEITLMGTNLNNVRSVWFGNVEVIRYSVRSATTLTFTVPENAPKGKQKIKFVLYEGADIETDQEITIGGTDAVVDPSLLIFDFEDRGGNNVANNSWSSIGEKSTADGVSGAFYEITPAKPANGTWVWLISDNWCEINANMAQVSGISDYVLKMDIRLRNDIPVESGYCMLTFIFGSQSVGVDIAPYLKAGDVFTTGGEWQTITIPLAEIAGLPDPTPQGGDWGLILNHGDASVDFVGLCVDNIRYELK